MSPARKADPGLEELLEFLRSHRGFDFTGYKRTTLGRRIASRMDEVRADGYEAYADYLEVHPDEFARLFDSVLINVTSFFRDRESWDVLAEEVIPEILEAKAPNAPIRLWVPGCASGEEAYTLAILFAEALGVEAFSERVKLFASDLDEDALATARAATYSKEALEKVPQEWVETYFEPTGARWAFRRDLRRPIVFGALHLLQDAPISKVDLIACRNTLMYFHSEAQGRILARFHFSLNDPGFLFLGRSEMLLTHGSLFAPRNMKHRIFQKVQKVDLRDRLYVLSQASEAEAIAESSKQVTLRENVFEAEPDAQIVVDQNGHLVMANEAARSTFGVRRRDVGRPFRDLEASYPPVELRSVMKEALAAGDRKVIEDVARPLPDRRTQYFDVLVTPVRTDGGGWLGVNVTFRDVTDNHRLREELQRSNQELETAYEELQSTNEELETTNEELQASVEEMETTNEALQASNEELHTMNDELRRRTDALSESNAFLNGLLGSLQAGVIIVDTDLQVMAWNRISEDLWGLRSDETEGLSLDDLDIGLPVSRIRDEMAACARGELDQFERHLDAVNRRGQSISVRTRIVPFFQEDRDIRRGAVLLTEEMKREA